ncbi:tRNA (adenosine(37)-N6)-threonylcarbamoyltransferase complex dimerization subunit type 1 TsaB [Mesobacillus subterraneus]|uniref:tRNA (adenosine(37)-N6)-threonylcarbamoyltransferase complex dimerization subunit type 1 TsaB n=1 Tax=Mesobacillus subterraneus TaxID=285983 RepID=UPI00203AD933|nr:tRNA (adenosine(37)-N6)-threonylcarbamoyltransferase complex dimerization subunit type 1 TsaB [Mesobacillus subterraneus]MCM3667172.1 tRNA (adenosine(37)-N6)-threonylcarbamoyltransferase complex dimerization subunit type 1 TsaB [Mesobacillus subterraneus]MCM3685961.1 tRNA (adenosine(37)-N6)-threonylcarbamoyltransferase complex dimerization subunit type 1 TsaB [Mesobacillus subterraneus]
MKVLSIDTSNYVLGIGLLDGETVMGEYISNIKKNHSVRVMPAIQTLMNECGIKPGDLSKIVVAEGPGSYTGVRIGVTIAKTLAWTLKIPLSGVSSLEVAAASAGRYFNGYVSPFFDARRGQIYTGLYKFEDQILQAVKEDQLVMSVDWVQTLNEMNSKVLFTSNDLHLHEKVISEGLADKAVFAAITEHNPRPAELALLGRDKESVDLHTFVPNYIRMAEAEANWLKSQENNK